MYDYGDILRDNWQKVHYRKVPPLEGEDLTSTARPLGNGERLDGCNVQHCMAILATERALVAYA